MYKKKWLFLTMPFIVIALGIGWFLVDSIRAGSPGALPGAFPITSEADAVALGKTVASANLSEGSFESILVLVSTQKLDSSGFSEKLKASGDEFDVDTIVGSDSANEFWVVTFSGAFSPKRIPSGIKTPVYSKIDIYLDGRDGSVIGVYMHD